MSDLAKALEGVSPMMKAKILRYIKDEASTEFAVIRRDLAEWSRAGSTPGNSPAFAEMTGWMTALRRLADDAQETLNPRK